MQQQEIDIEALKKDEEFLGNLKTIEQEMRTENSIAKGYQVLDAKLLLEAPEDEINDIFTFIVNTAFDVLAENLTKHKGFDMAVYEDLATARAIYEHGIQRYSENDKKGAKEILGITAPEATFYIWLKVDDEIEFTTRLYREYNLKVIPGSFLGREGQGKSFVRLALVYEAEKTREALERIKKAL